MANSEEYLSKIYDKYLGKTEDKVAAALMVLAHMINSIDYTLKKKGHYDD